MTCLRSIRERVHQPFRDSLMSTAAMRQHARLAAYEQLVLDILNNPDVQCRHAEGQDECSICRARADLAAEALRAPTDDE